MSQKKIAEEIDWKKIPNCTGTIYDPDPSLEGWMLVHGPLIPAIQAYKNKVFVNNKRCRTEEPEDLPIEIPPKTTKTHSTLAPLNNVKRQRRVLPLVGQVQTLQSSLPNVQSVVSQSKSTTLPTIKQAVKSQSTTFSAGIQTKKSDQPIVEPVESLQLSTTPSCTVTQSLEPQPTKNVLSKTTHGSGSTEEPLPDIRSFKKVVPNKEKALDPQRSRRVLPNIGQTALNFGHESAFRKTTESTELYESLSPEQKEIHDFVVREKKNVFYSGSAGTGKSVLLRSIVSTLQATLLSEEIAVTASTGIAAVNINGSTIYSFALIGFGDKAADSYISSILCKPNKAEQLRKTKVLIIDEISMLSAHILDLLNTVLKAVRKNQKPFGGIQVLFCGDFYQLPPVNTLNGLAFKALCWEKTIDKMFILKTPFRQKDQGLANMLNEIRTGIVSLETEDVFRKLARPLKNQSDIEPTHLYPLRDEVDRANTSKLEKLSGIGRTFVAHDTGNDSYLKNCMAPKDLVLKVGCQVMLLKNLTPTLVNGSVGIVESFSKKYENSRELPVVKFTNGERRRLGPEEWDIEISGEVVAKRTQIPLMLAWAISIHKSQGQTIDWMQVDLAKTFEVGQAYVALSRGVSLENMRVLNFNSEVVKVHSGVAEFYKQFN